MKRNVVKETTCYRLPAIQNRSTSGTIRDRNFGPAFKVRAQILTKKFGQHWKDELLIGIKTKFLTWQTRTEEYKARLRQRNN